MSKKIKTLSLFSGAGGLDIGFHQAGFQIEASVELSEKYAATLRTNCGKDQFFGPDTNVFCQDVIDFDPEPFRDAGIECIIGGPPCQTFSAAGRRSGGVIGTSDKRGRLFERFAEILAIIQPSVFVFENVYGLPGANGGEPWRAILESFSSLGYNLNFEVVDAADYGVPQHRERLFLVGSRHSHFKFPLPTHGPDSMSGQPLRSVADAISDLQDVNETCGKGPGGMYGHLLPAVPPGLNYSFFTAEMGHPKPVFAWRSKFHDLLYKVDPDYPCRTLKAQPGKFTGPFHWNNRHFTVPELKRLQTFPDEYQLEGSNGVVLEQIGNSVPPKLAFIIAAAIKFQFYGQKIVDLQDRPLGFKSSFRSRQRARSKAFKSIAQKAIAEQSRNGALEIEPRILDENYFVSLSRFFHATKNSDTTNLGPRFASVKLKDHGDRLDLDFSVSDNDQAPEGEIRISGLSKYLQRIDKVVVRCRLKQPSDVFYVWWSIQAAMIDRSRFFSLIDIYGHYANRGDTVKIDGSYGFPLVSPLTRALDFFLNSENCGEFLGKQAFATVVEETEGQISRVVEEMRAVRMDMRSAVSHPILGTERLICTYPFPLLSPKALVVSRVEFLENSA